MTVPQEFQQHWDKRGFYTVNGAKYYSKLQAIMAAGPTGHLEFNFNDAVYGRANWATEPAESLDELYRRRAWQLRERYDHLVLCYSSGSDSTNILHTFLNNNIPLDEVFCYGPMSTTQGQGTVDSTTPGEYMYREIDLIALPYLRELSKKHQFKVTVYDWSQDMVSGFKDSDWVWTEVNARLGPSVLVRNRLHDSYAHLNLVDRGRRVAFIYGIDKPRVVLRDGGYYLAFLDLLLNQSVGMGAAATGSVWDHDEFFYWTPDLPELLIKQAHVIRRYFEANPDKKVIIQDAHLGSWRDEYRDVYYDIIKRLIYPTFNADIWQAKKNSNLTAPENDGWFWRQDYEGRRHWLAGVDQVRKTLDQRWFNQGRVEQGFVGSWSRWHKIG